MKAKFACFYLFFAWQILPCTLLASEDKILEQLNANNDQGFWLEQNFNFKFFPKWKVLLHSEQRWGANYRQLWYYEFEAVFQYELWKKSQCSSSLIESWTIGPGYSIVRNLEKNNLGVFHWPWASRPLVETHLALKILNWKLRQRLRLEYRDYLEKHYNDHGILRYRLVFSSPGSGRYGSLIPMYLMNGFLEKIPIIAKQRRG